MVSNLVQLKVGWRVDRMVGKMVEMMEHQWAHSMAGKKAQLMVDSLAPQLGSLLVDQWALLKVVPRGNKRVVRKVGWMVHRKVAPTAVQKAHK